MQVKKVRSSHFVIACTHYQYTHRSGKRSLSTGGKKNIRAKYHNSLPYVLEYIISTINPSPSHLSAGKSLCIKPPPAARVLYCLSFFSTDKRSGSGIYCIHKSRDKSRGTAGVFSHPQLLNLLCFIRGGEVL